MLFPASDVVPILTRMSNHTDFDPLRLHPQVNFHYVQLGEEIPAADLIILPGSKSVRADLQFLRENGWQQHLDKHLRYGGKLLGICGGFQMLGKQVHDPHGLEGSAGSEAGFAYFDYQTTIETGKQLRRVSTQFSFIPVNVSGYEIRAGRTSGSALQSPALITPDSESALSSDHQIIGTYLHGLFDQTEACSALLKWAGLNQVIDIDYRDITEQGIDRIAQCVAENMDMKAIDQQLAKRY